MVLPEYNLRRSMFVMNLRFYFQIGQLGGIPLLVSMLKGPEDYEEERLAAVKALYMLSFDETNKGMIKADHDTMALLQDLQSSKNKEIQQAASGVMWEIDGKKEHAHSSGLSQVCLFFHRKRCVSESNWSHYIESPASAYTINNRTLEWYDWQDVKSRMQCGFKVWVQMKSQIVTVQMKALGRYCVAVYYAIQDGSYLRLWMKS